MDFNLDDKKMADSILDERELDNGYTEEAVEADEADEEDDAALFEDFVDDELDLDETDLDITDLGEDNLLNDQDILDDDED